MKTLRFLTFGAVLLWSSGAQAFNYFSVGPLTGPSPGDPGIAPYEFMAATFDGPNAWFVTERDSVPHQDLIYRGTTVNVAAAPAGDTSYYEVVAPRQTAIFTFGSVTPLIHTISFYLGSIDAYNRIVILGRGNVPLGVITGADLPRDDGDEFAAASNRRVYITNLPSTFTGIEFQSFGISEEYDDIAVSQATFCIFNTNPCMPNGMSFPTLPRPSPSNPKPIPGAPSDLSVRLHRDAGTRSLGSDDRRSRPDGRRGPTFSKA